MTKRLKTNKIIKGILHPKPKINDQGYVVTGVYMPNKFHFPQQKIRGKRMIFKDLHN